MNKCGLCKPQKQNNNNIKIEEITKVIDINDNTNLNIEIKKIRKRSDSYNNMKLI